MADVKCNNGGPAFPTSLMADEYASVGMSLRDYFAAKAMLGFLSEPGTPQLDVKRLSKFAADCYALADAMLAERDK